MTLARYCVGNTANFKYDENSKLQMRPHNELLYRGPDLHAAVVNREQLGDSKTLQLSSTAIVRYEAAAVWYVHDGMCSITQHSYEMHPALFEQGLNRIIARDIQIILAKLSCLCPAVCTAENQVLICFRTSLAASHSNMCIINRHSMQVCADLVAS